MSAALIAVGAVAGCSDDERKRTPAKPPGPPELSIERIRSIGGDTWVAGDPSPCVAPGTDAGGTIIVEIGRRTADGLGLANWTFASPGACGNTPQCGLVVIELVDSETGKRVHTAVAVQVNIPIELSALGLPDGVYDLRVALIDDLGRPFSLDGGVVSAEVTGIRVSPSCATALDSGAGDAMSEDGGSNLDAGVADAAPRDATSPMDATADALLPGDGGNADVLSGDAEAPDASEVDASLDGATGADASDDGGAPSDARPRDATDG